jgi:16S rRNA (cytosine967-C5)-methyltransferase
MTPAARVQAAIELLDEIIGAAREGGAAADTLIGRYFKTRRYAGSKDRRAVRELVYRAIRRAGDAPSSGRAAMLGLASEDVNILAAFDGSPRGPAPAGKDEPAAEGGIAPAWLLRRFDPLVGETEYPALLERAPLDLRANRLKGSPKQALAALPEAAPTPHARHGLRMPDGARIEETDPWRAGLVEVQDEGSQLACAACEAVPGMRVLDLCAGAGGKTLALAADMANEGRVVAADTDRARLSRLPPRAERAGVTIVETRLINPGREIETLAGETFDLVLVDAPCSGSGTWRRNPETRWRLTPERLSGLTALQARLLDLAAGLLAPGGRLAYIVCSLLDEEGRGQAAAFGERSSLVPEDVAMPAGRVAGAGRLLTPGHDGTDGFFVARWRRPC